MCIEKYLHKKKQIPSNFVSISGQIKPQLRPTSFQGLFPQPRTQACSRDPSDQRRLGTERDRRIFPTSLTGDVTSAIAEDDWERGCFFLRKWEERPVDEPVELRTVCFPKPNFPTSILVYNVHISVSTGNHRLPNKRRKNVKDEVAHHSPASWLLPWATGTTNMPPETF